MQKLINSLGKAFKKFPLLIVLFLSCSKEPVTPPSPPGPTLPSIPQKLDLTADPTTVLYDSSAKVSFETDATNVSFNGQPTKSPITVSNIKKDTSLTFTATNVNEYGSSPAFNKAIVIKAYSKNSSAIELFGKHHMVVNRSCLNGTENSPNVVWIYGIVSCDTYQLYANGDAYITFGPCRSNPGVVSKASFGWVWADSKEESIDFGGDIWFVKLGVNGYEEYQIYKEFYQYRKFIKN